MTTAQLRRKIHVTNFSIDQFGIKINYLFDNDIRLLEYTPYQACETLEEIGAVDSFMVDVLIVDGTPYTFDEYVHEIGLWQWGALCMVIHHEQQKERKQILQSIHQ